MLPHWPPLAALALALVLQHVVAAPGRTRHTFARNTTAQAPDFTWGSGPVRGVNLGGWFVLEPWITPSLFTAKPDWVVDEWTYGQYMAAQNDSMGEITTHWASWITETEMINIAEVGLNTVRIPIGFWSLIPLENGEPYLVGAYDYLKQAVLLDLHGCPGSQNGFDNSGLRGTRAWFANTSNVDRTLTAIELLVSEFTGAAYGAALSAIELVNEPYPYSQAELDFLKSYYESAYTSVRDTSGGLPVVIDEAFQGLAEWEGFMLSAQGYNDVVLDTHIYAMFDLATLSYSYAQNLAWTCAWAPSLERANADLWTIVGEFTTANTDCAYWLNGRGTGARYDNTLNTSAALLYPGDCGAKSGADPASWTQEYVDHLGRSFEAQTWIFWCWKTEQAADWSMQTGISYGWIPTPITAKPHGAPCTSSNTTAETSASAATRHWPFDSTLALAVPVVCLVLAV
ncbi:hypothetical protein Q5752_003710 [Cryptotrichosporon argae]